jgi:hypothetical protein
VSSDVNGDIGTETGQTSGFDTVGLGDFSGSGRNKKRQGRQ